MRRFIFHKPERIKVCDIVDVCLLVVVMVAVLSVVVGCQAVVLRAGSDTAYDVCQTLPHGGGSIPMRQVYALSDQSFVHLVNPDDFRIVRSWRFGLCDFDLQR